MFRYCPSCASENIRFEKQKVFRCPDCGFTYYHNTAAATGCIIVTKKGILFEVRGKDPGKGRLDLPGGFVDPGEGAFEGLRRELTEELGWDPCTALSGAEKSPQRLFTLFASFPNKYPYKNIPYNTCDFFFYLKAPDLQEKDLRLEEAEIAGVRFIRPEDINPEDIAFESARRAVAGYLREH
ncbi:MAG: NUDIX domain-containing protein [Treponema sp.]|jgi:ADP-ribose pyrophosphatase YjhB (NUDIX family)|nr:NUDIX domain-containing protein [Treponema sp.]